MTTQEIQKLQQAGFTIDQIAEIDKKMSRRAGFRALIRMAQTVQDYETPESEWTEAWKIAAVMRCAQ